MRRILGTLAIAAAATGFVVSGASGQGRPLTLAGVTAASPEQTSARTGELMEAGDLHRHAFRLDRAARAYREAARLEEAAGRLPVDPLWKLASVQHMRRRWSSSARALEHLAGLAERYGHPAVQAEALLEAVILHHKSGDGESARRTLFRLLPLQRSPHLPADLQRQIRARLLQ